MSRFTAGALGVTLACLSFTSTFWSVDGLLSCQCSAAVLFLEETFAVFLCSSCPVAAEPRGLSGAACGPHSG